MSPAAQLGQSQRDAEPHVMALGDPAVPCVCVPRRTGAQCGATCRGTQDALHLRTVGAAEDSPLTGAVQGQLPTPEATWLRFSGAFPGQGHRPGTRPERPPGVSKCAGDLKAAGTQASRPT